MYRRLSIALLCVAGIAIGCLLVFQWRKLAAYRTPIPKDASFIIDINVDGLFRTLAWNAMLHPGYYIKKQQQAGTDSVSIRKAFSLPGRLFIYGLDNDTSHSFYITLKVKNEQALIDYAAQKLGIKINSHPGTGIISGVNSEGNLALASNGSWAVAGWSPGSTPSVQLMKDLLANKQAVEAGHHPLLDKHKPGAHLTWLTKEGFATLAFESGHITIGGNWPGATGQQTYQQLIADIQAPIQFSANAGFAPLLKKQQYIIKGHTINGDSVLHYYKGFAGFIMRDSVMQTDTVITYGYNDNFETVPQKTLAEKSVPGITFLLSADAGGLYSYLSGCGIINKDSSFNRELFPLYKLYAHVQGQQFYISTGNNPAPGISDKPGAPLFNITMNAKALKSYINYSAVNNYLDLLSGLTLQVSGKEKNGTMNGSIGFYNKKINAFMLLLSVD